MISYTDKEEMTVSVLIAMKVESSSAYLKLYHQNSPTLLLLLLLLHADISGGDGEDGTFRLLWLVSLCYVLSSFNIQTRTDNSSISFSRHQNYMGSLEKIRWKVEMGKIF